MADTELFHETALTQPEPGEERMYGDPEDGGDLLTMEEEDAIKVLLERWDSQTPVLKPLIEQWKVNQLRRKGIPGVRMKSDQTAHVPKNAASADAVPSFNKLADTLRRLAALLFSDPPASEAVPHSDSNDDKDASETATQILQEIDGESQLDDAHTAERTFDRASDCGSGFIFYFVDPKGGPRVPLEVQAGSDPITGAEAQSVDDAVYNPAYPPELEIEWPEYKRRFVRQDGSLTDERSEAATRWAPMIKSRIYTAKNVRFLPISSRDIWDAEGVLVVDFPSWQELLKEHPELAELSKDEKQAILSARPKQHTDLMSSAEIRALNATAKEDRPVWRLRFFQRQCPSYPKGAHIVVLGGRKAIVRDPWVAEMPDGTVEHLDIPITQYGQLEEGGRGGAYKVGMGEVLGGPNELRTYVWAQIIHNLERIRNQKTLLPSMGKMHSKMLQRAGKNVLPFQPGYKPEYEEIPNLPSIVMDAFELTGKEMNHASGLEQAALGVEDSSVKSGRHAFAIISQVKQGLSTLIRNIERGWVRGARIKLQLIRAYYTNEQQLLWSGDDDEWKQKAWRRADLGSTRDVRLKAGTLTMFSPAQKEALAHEWRQAGLIDESRYYEIISNNMGATIGLQQDPRRSRIKRQLNRWREGPPEEWEAPAPAMQPAMQPVVVNGLPVVDPLSGQPQMQPVMEEVPDPVTGVVVAQPKMEPALDPGGRPLFEPDPTLQRIFEPVPADQTPATAQIRFNLISEAMNSKKYLEMHPAWRSALDQEFYRMRDAVAIAMQMAQPAPPQPSGGSGQKPGASPAQEGYSEQAVASGAAA